MLLIRFQASILLYLQLIIALAIGFSLFPRQATLLATALGSLCRIFSFSSSLNPVFEYF